MARGAALCEEGTDPAAVKAEAKRRQPDTVREVAEQFIEKWHRPGTGQPMKSPGCSIGTFTPNSAIETSAP